ncbi:uncharacterized protein LOC124366035 [Homalodisca vitripennis]|uniref:uncharacterized protein LOC124366035 n=1 Tax=Homalodisca vitripennis TaxID=197043 RepID=UPI001EECA271|nr:uncharacterized protein LOC124366035 [Homalodisca vitripennis]
MYTAQILTLLASLALSRSQKFDIYGRPKCCSDSLSPLIHQQQFWQDTLREATYQSIIRHLDFSGTLDGRLDRDQRLWRHLREARYIIDENPSLENVAEEIRSGTLLVRSQSSTKPDFEFHQTDKPTFECFRNQCNENNSLLALWRVRRTDNPYTLWIRVKLPTVAGSQTEDMYEYNTKYGLKKLNPDPFEYKSLKGQKGHRFSIQPKKKGDFKSIDRMDFRFPGLNKGFGIGRIMPTSILYNSPIKSGKIENGWVISPPRKPHPGIIVETGQRKPPSIPNFDHLSGPFVTSGPHGFHHIIHSLPSISPPQNLDHPTQEYRGFLPSIGPISPPPPIQDRIFLRSPLCSLL